MQRLPPRGHVDHSLLSRALDLAEAAAAFSSPNPTVGCVLARGDAILGSGAHFYEARDHAEIAALRDAQAAGHDVQGAAAYVTLEPCSHHGRTGPCADALIGVGISRCVVATMDPNPLVRGGGLAKLRNAGVTVDLVDPSTPEAQRARRLNDAFAFSVLHGRPFVTLKAAVSGDGKLAPPDAMRLRKAPFWLTGDAARKDVQRLRHRSDAILTGIGTVLADDPSLTDRTGLPRRRSLLRVILDADLRLPSESGLVRSAQRDVLVFADGSAPEEREAALRDRGVDVIRVPSQDRRLDLDYVLAALAAIPVRSVLVEAGSTLNAALVERDLVDQLILYEAPSLLGPDALPFAHGHSLQTLKGRLTGKTEQRFANGDEHDLRLDGYLHDPWAGV